jgi:hypothetical protein
MAERKISDRAYQDAEPGSEIEKAWLRQHGMAPTKIQEGAAQRLVATLKANQELRATLREAPLRTDLIQQAVKAAGGDLSAAVEKLAEVGQRENAALQARIDAYGGPDRVPDAHGREFGQENFGERLSDQQIEARDAWRADVTKISETYPTRHITKPHEPEPRNADEALDQLARKGLLAPEGSQLRDQED